MKTTILAAATALTLAFSFAPSFAAEHRGNSAESGSNVENRCDSILADRQGHSAGDVRYCEQHR